MDVFQSLYIKLPNELSLPLCVSEFGIVVNPSMVMFN